MTSDEGRAPSAGWRLTRVFRSIESNILGSFGCVVALLGLSSPLSCPSSIASAVSAPQLMRTAIVHFSVSVVVLHPHPHPPTPLFLKKSEGPFYNVVGYFVVVAASWSYAKKSRGMRLAPVAVRKTTSFTSWPKCFLCPQPSLRNWTRRPSFD